MKARLRLIGSNSKIDSFFFQFDFRSMQFQLEGGLDSFADIFFEPAQVSDLVQKRC